MGLKSSGVAQATVVSMDLELQKYATIEAHKSKAKVKQIQIDLRRQFIFSIGEDRKLSVSNYGEQRKRLLHVKMSNVNPKTMKLHPDLQRLFVAMKQQILFVFDVSQPTPIAIHSIQLGHPITRLNIDLRLNLLQGLTRRGSFMCFQLS
mmetsp:Transcript_7758/g.13017  ORF Transcript_7758/g.13017 Transcript_7758/m.13017 type:complete len:149 (+) Transcript_7758:1113-1559(+)